MPEIKATLRLETGKRWWFNIARVVTILLIRAGIVKDTDRAASWLARNGMWFRTHVDG
jgi:hypothetical protein